MKIGVISDTHATRPTSSLIKIARGAFSDVSLILHAGDHTNLSVLDAFSNKRVISVRGNKDKKPISDLIPEKQVLHINGYQIGLVHGWGGARGIEDRVMSCFNNVNCIVYGHTHRPSNRIHDGVLLFNPGSFSGSRFWKRRPTAGILTIRNGISGKIFPVE